MKPIKTPYEIAGWLALLTGGFTVFAIVVIDGLLDATPLLFIGFLFFAAGLLMLIKARNHHKRHKRFKDSGYSYPAEVLDICKSSAGYKVSGFQTFYLLCSYVDPEGRACEVTSGLMSLRTGAFERIRPSDFHVQVVVHKVNPEDYLVQAYRK